MRRISALLFLLLCFSLAFSGCTKSSSDNSSSGGGGGGGGEGSGRVRFLNAVPEIPVAQIYLNGSNEFFNLHFGELTTYDAHPVGAGDFEMRVLVDPSPLTLLQETFRRKDTSDTTVILFGDPSYKGDNIKNYKVSTKIFTDVHIPEVDMRFKLRTINAIPGSKAFDVFVVKPNADLNTILPFISGISFRGDPLYYDGNVTQARVIFSRREGKSRVTLYESPIIDFAAHPAVTLFAIPGGGGVDVITSLDSDL